MSKPAQKTYVTNLVTVSVPLTFYDNQGELLVKPREVATILAIKQPFQFTADLKERFGEVALYKGAETIRFRNTEIDSDRTVFVRVRDILTFLEEGVKNHKVHPVYKGALMEQFNFLLLGGRGV